MNPTYQQLDEYTHYLENQLQKFSAFMLTQKKLNEKHTLIEGMINRIMEKILKIEDKIKLIEIKEKDNLEEMRKIKGEKGAMKSIEIRIQNLQHEITPLLIKQQQMEKDSSKQVYLSPMFLNKQYVQQIITKNKDEIESKIKKLQIEVDINKENFSKIHSQISRLYNPSNRQNIYTPQTRQLKKKNYYGHKSTTNFQMLQSQSQNRNKLSLSNSHEKYVKSKKNQQKYGIFSIQNSHNDQKKLHSKSHKKKLSKKKSLERLRKVNQDYMTFP